MLSFIVALALCPPILGLVNDFTARRHWKQGTDYLCKAAVYLVMWGVLELMFAGVYIMSNTL